MREHTLTPRLMAVADLVPQGAALADVGTDHAYLPVWLLCRGRLRSALASDVRPGPLQRARQTAQRYDCADRMEFRLCDGLDGIGREQADAVTIAGMGGETICDILSRAEWLRDASVTLILQPMSQQHVLRAWLWRHGFSIEKETIAREGKRLYTIILARYGGAEELTAGQEWAGRQSPELDQPLRGEYLASLERKLRRTLDGMADGTAGEDERARRIRGVYDEICVMREEWERWHR